MQRGNRWRIEQKMKKGSKMGRSQLRRWFSAVYNTASLHAYSIDNRLCEHNEGSAGVMYLDTAAQCYMNTI